MLVSLSRNLVVNLKRKTVVSLRRKILVSLKRKVVVSLAGFYSKQRGIDKAKEYFRDEFEIILSEQKDWSVIKNYQTIRNLIVHNNANVFKNYDLPLSEQKEWAIINVLEKDISVSETGFIFIC